MISRVKKDHKMQTHHAKGHCIQVRTNERQGNVKTTIIMQQGISKEYCKTYQ
jgi:hypothetical protein